MNTNLKIAFVSNDKKHIVGSFGSAKYFEVFTIENGEITNQETREAYKDKAEKELPNILNKEGNQSKPVFSLNVVDKSKEKHMKLAKTISDCHIVIARDMCENAKDSINRFNMKHAIIRAKNFEDGIKVAMENIAN